MTEWLTQSPEDFLSSAPPSMNGNTPWAQRYAAEIRRAWYAHAAQDSRTLQTHLGPSELGVQCDRQVAGKLAGLPATNHVVDPWPSLRGKALHAHAEDVFAVDNLRHGYQRWLTERRVTPHPEHPGTADLYDAEEQAVVDHKFLGESSMAKIRKVPPRKYRRQLLLYGLGYFLEGFDVRRVVIIGYPATAGSLDGLYVWEAPFANDAGLLPEVIEELTDTFTETARRKGQAAAMLRGELQFLDVPSAANDDECYFCLGGDTEVVTRQGIKPIAELAAAGRAELLVPKGRANADKGVFIDVPISEYGVEQLYEVTLKRYRATKTVYATASHRWFTDEGARYSTLQLREGQRLASVAATRSYRIERMSVAVAQGFTFGDGAHGQGERPGTLAVYGRSEKSAMLEHFGPVKVKDYTSPSGDSVQHVYGLPRSWKALPDIGESRGFLTSWLAGYFAADGSVSSAGRCSISSADKAHLEYVRSVAAVLGIGYGPVTTKSRVGIGQTEATDLHTVTLSPRDVPEWFWLLPTHRERVSKLLAKPARDTKWSVVSVKPTGRFEPVYCATVPGVGAFALSDGLTTGNCPFYRPQAAHDGGTGCPGPRKGLS